MGSDGAKRIDIISDTHGRLSDRLLAQLEGADLILHAGDLTSEADYFELATIAPLKAVLGNNDFFYDYGPDVHRQATFEYEGLRFAMAHYREDLPERGVDVAVCGHTHKPVIVPRSTGLLINPGSPTYPRSMRGDTMARLQVRAGQILGAEIVEL